MIQPQHPELPSSEYEENHFVEVDTRKILEQVAESARCLLNAPAALIAVATNGREIFVAATPEARKDALRWDTLAAALNGTGSSTGVHSPLVVESAAQATDDTLAIALRTAEFNGLLAVPIVSEQQPLGALAVGSTDDRNWQSHEIQIMQELAALAALAIEHRMATPNTDEHDQAVAQLRRSFDDGLAGHAVAMPSGRIVACNSEFARIAGFNSIEEAMTCNLRELESSPGAFNALLERLEQSPLIPLEELRFMRRNGAPAQVLARVAATVDADRNVTEIRAYLVDITQHFQLEQQARDSAERLRLLELATQDVLWEWNLGTGRVSWNAAVARRFRYNPEEVRASIDWHIEHIHPDDRDRVLSGIERAIVGVEHYWTDEYRFLRGDGTYAMILDRAYIVRSDRGEPERIVGWILDITERKVREESLRFLARAAATLESALEIESTAAQLARLGVPTLADVCLVDLLDGDGALRRCAVAHVEPGREQYLGLGTIVANGSQSPGAPLTAVRSGAPHFLAVSDFDASRHLGIASEAGVRAYMVVPIAARDHILGAATFGFTDARRHFDPYDLMTAKELAHLAGQAMENAFLYDTVRRAVTTRNEVLGVVSHDLRTPVNTIMATLSVLSDSMRERRGEVRKWFDMAYRATEQMKALIEDLLDTSRIESQQFTVDRAESNARTIIDEACDMLRPVADTKNVTIVAQMPNDLPRISVDSPQIVRVLGNLIGNAIKFSRTGGRIEVCSVVHDRELRVSVKDQGEGIPDDQKSRVFNRFWTGRGDRRGAGLGLAIAKGIVEAHGGRIWVESQEDVGSTFTFTLPIFVNPDQRPVRKSELPRLVQTEAGSPSRTAD